MTHSELVAAIKKESLPAYTKEEQIRLHSAWINKRCVRSKNLLLRSLYGLILKEARNHVRCNLTSYEDLIIEGFLVAHRCLDRYSPTCINRFGKEVTGKFSTFVEKSLYFSYISVRKEAQTISVPKSVSLKETQPVYSTSNDSVSTEQLDPNWAKIPTLDGRYIGKRRRQNKIFT